MSKKKPDISPEDRTLFRDSMRGVHPLKNDGKAEVSQTPRTKLQPKKNSMEDFITPPTSEPCNYSANDTISFFNAGLQHKLIQKFKQGNFPIDSTLDLHGMISNEAYQALSHFLNTAATMHWQCVLIIHGKGYSSPNQIPILKNHIYSWLKNHPRVLGFHSAKPYHGGTGAVYVLLKK